MQEVIAAITIGKSLAILAQRIKAMIALAPSAASILGSASMGTCHPSFPVTLQTDHPSLRYDSDILKIYLRIYTY